MLLRNRRHYDCLFGGLLGVSAWKRTPRIIRSRTMPFLLRTGAATRALFLTWPNQ